MLKKFLINNKHTHLNTKLLIYKSLLKPIWIYGLQLWGNAKISNFKKIQTFQNITLRKITNSPPYISNHTLHINLRQKTIQEEAKYFYKRFPDRLIIAHTNPLIHELASNEITGNPHLQLKRKWCRDS